MANMRPEAESEYFSRSELDRCLLGVAFAALIITSTAHIASYFGIVIIQSRAAQRSLGWILVAFSMWVLFGGNRSTTKVIPRIWSALMGLGWLNALFHVAVTEWFRLNTADSLLVHARKSSALQSAFALSIFVLLWFRPSAASVAEPLDGVKAKESFWSPPVRVLATIGIALPTAVIVACYALQHRNWENPDLINWIMIIAVFWCIAGMISTGIYIIRDAIRRDT